MSSGPFETLDATGIKVIGALAPVGSLWNPASPTIVTSDGLRYTNNSIQDPNGNFITLSSSSIVDSIGRSISDPPTQGSASNTSTSICPSGPLTVTKAVAWTVPAANGGNATYTFCYVTVTPNMPSTMNLSNQTVHGSIGPSTNLQSVVLPNGVAWEFEYDDQDAILTNNGQPVTYGTLSKITLPTGASISYTWINAGAGLAAKNSTFCNNGGRWLAGRTVTDLDGIARKWTYTYKVPFGSYHGTVVTDPLGNDTAHVFGLGSGGLGGGCTAYETQTLYYLGSYSSGTPLRTVNTTYLSTANGNTFPNPVLNVVPTSTTTIEANNQTTATTKGYDSGFSYLDHFGSNTASGIYGKVTSEQVYDYGSGAHGALLRTINTTYAWQSPNPNYATYLSNNLLNLEYSVQIKDGGGTQRAYTFYGYDESGLVSSTITKQHSAGESHPGNETSVHRWLNSSTTATTNCNVSVSNGYLVSSKLYYDTGEVQKTTDPCGYITSFQYNAASPFFGVYLTTATNQLGQSTTYTYDSNPGVVTSIKDANLQVTSKQYDVMNRVTQISFPDGGWITACYTDTGGPTCTHSAPPYEKVITKAITSSPTLSEISTLVFDGLGRLSQTQLNSDSPSATYTLTTYDALGRKSKVYNPTRCSPITTNCGESTWGYTTYIYDALGRPCVGVPPGGTAVSTCPTTAPAGDMFTSYSGRATSVQDEGNGGAPVQLISQVDGLGRLVSVCEVSSATQLGAGGAPGACGQDIAKTGFLTSYSYDPLNNLLTVNQGSLAQRTFAYDSLSRLLCAANPETGGSVACPNPDNGTYTPGTTRYGYDANGNLTLRVRPAPNQTSPSTTVTTSYQYDPLNRMTQQSYSDGVTLPALFGYDQTNITMGSQQFTISNSIGRLSWTCRETPTGNCHPMTATSYDPMGRIAELWQEKVIGTNNIWVSYLYDLMGDETDRNVSGADYTSAYNAAGRLTTFTATGWTNLLANGHYDAFGHIISANFANGLSESWAYDTRERLTAAAVGTNCSAGACNGSTAYGYAVSYTPNSNVLSSTDTVNGTWPSYIYDNFNRLISSSCTANCPNGGSSEAFSYAYDRYGNRWNQTVTAGSGPQPSYAFTGAQNGGVPNNRMDSFSYDAAGNLLNDGTYSYTYDPENRIISASNGPTTYIYDAEGQRVGRAGNAGMDMIYDREGHVILYNATVSPDSPMVQLYVDGMHLGGYVVNSAVTNADLYYDHADWLGTERAHSNMAGTLCEATASLSFGDGQVIRAINGGCADSNDVSPNHFTGKERDTESGLDEFGARYYASTMGRFMTPDWAAKPTNVPYASFGNPQSLNLYSYVNNNPTTTRDPDGHCLEDACVIEGGIVITAMAVSYLSSPPGQQMLHNAVNDISSIGSAISGFFHPSNSGQNAPPPPTVPTNVSQGTPASTSQQGAVNTSPMPLIVVSPGGDAIPVPNGASGPVPVVNPQGNTTGVGYTGGSGGNGLDSRTTDVRVMDPTPARGASPGYPNGYVSYGNANGQGVNPQTGQTVSNADPSRHIPLSPAKSCPSGGGSCP